jgi:hypothetical protein
MVLQRSNFEIPARFTFHPHSAEWRLATAETVEWAEEQKLWLMAPIPANANHEKNWMRVRIEVPNADALGVGGLMLGIYPTYTVLLDRASMPPGVLQAHENHCNTPDISGRYFQVLICQQPELTGALWALKPGSVTKNAWVMRDEFLRLDADPELGWEWSARCFLNKWGFWELNKGYVEVWSDLASFSRLAALYELGTKEKFAKPDFMMVLPHLLRKQQQRYRKALLPSNARRWLSLHPLNLETAGEFPFFRVRKSCCADAIEATITIDHLAGIKHGICKRCHTVFQRETNHKKNYCSERCFNAAGVQRWREKQRNATKKGAKRNAKR